MKQILTEGTVVKWNSIPVILTKDTEVETTTDLKNWQDITLGDGRKDEGENKEI